MDYGFSINLVRPDSEFVINGDDYDQIIWLDENTTKPTREELEEAYNNYKINYSYKEKREREYPAINDLVVALWESVVESDNTARDALQTNRLAVKAKYPKPV